MTSSPRPASPPRGAGSRKRAPLDDAPPSSRSRARRASASAASPSSAEKEKGRIPFPPAGERRVILHADADAFFCQVERLRDPSLARAPALAIRQHGDVIAADAGARAAGVSKRDAPADALRKLAEVRGVLRHVPTTEGQRVTYRPYLAASALMHEVIAADATKRAILDAVERVLPNSSGSRDEGSTPRQETNNPHRRVLGVVVEKASIDEAFVQLPAGSTLARDAEKAARALRDVVLERAGIRVSVGAASNKTLAKFASAAVKRRPIVGDGSSRSASRRDVGVVSRAPGDDAREDGGARAGPIASAREDGGPLGSSSPGVLAVKSDEDVRALLAVTPATKLPGCGGYGFDAKLAAAIHRGGLEREGSIGASRSVPTQKKSRAQVPSAADFASFFRDDASRVVAALGLAPPAARSALDAASGRCAAPVTPRGVANKSIGVHTSLSETRRRMPAEAFERGETSAAGGAPGFFEPLATREKERLARLADAMARDLAGRVRDDACAALRAASGERIEGGEETSIIAASFSFGGYGGVSDSNPSRPKRRRPRTLTATLAHRPPARGTGGAPPAIRTTSRSGAFPDEAFGDEEEAFASVVAGAAKALVFAAAAGIHPNALVTRVSLVASKFHLRGGPDDRGPHHSRGVLSKARVVPSRPSPASCFAARGEDENENGNENAAEGGEEKGGARSGVGAFDRGAAAAGPDDGSKTAAAEDGEDGGPFALDASRPLPAAAILRALARGDVRGEDVVDAVRAREARRGEATRVGEGA